MSGWTSIVESTFSSLSPPSTPPLPLFSHALSLYSYSPSLSSPLFFSFFRYQCCCASPDAWGLPARDCVFVRESRKRSANVLLYVEHVLHTACIVRTIVTKRQGWITSSLDERVLFIPFFSLSLSLSLFFLSLS